MLNLNNYVNIKFKPHQENHAMHSTMFLTFPVALNIFSLKNHSGKSDILTVSGSLITVKLFPEKCFWRVCRILSAATQFSNVLTECELQLHHAIAL